jgi:hypothetical protein
MSSVEVKASTSALRSAASTVPYFMFSAMKGNESLASSKKVRGAISGAGNCTSSLVQGVHYYRQALPEDFVSGHESVRL